MLDLHRLEVLRHFAMLGSITATAAELGYSASAISQQLATLEKEAGIALLERTAQRATLTDAGRELAEHAVVVLGAVESAQSSMRARIGVVAGRVDVSCIPGLAAVLAPHLADLQRVHPDLAVTAHEAGSIDAATDVLEGRTDLAVVDDWNDRPAAAGTGLTVHQLRREPVALAVPADHPQATGTVPVTAAVLRRITATETWLCAPQGHLSRIAGDARLAEFDTVPVRRWEFEGLHVLAAVVAAGAGVALLPTSVIADRPGVLGRRLRPRMQRRVIALTRTSRQQDPALVACLDAARAALAPSAPNP